MSPSEMKFLRRRIIETLCTITILSSGLALVGHVTGHSSLGKWVQTDPGMAMNTAGCLIVLAVAVLLLHRCGE